MAKEKLSDQFVVSAQKIVGAEERVNIYNEDDIQGVPPLGGFSKWAVFIIGFLASASSLYELFFGNFDPALQRPLHLFLMGTLTLMVYPSTLFKPGSTKEGLLSLFSIILLFAGCTWAFLEWTPLYIDPYPTKFGTVMGVIAILLVLEVTRRSVGLPMTIIGLAMLAFCFVGPYLPRFIAHPGFSFENVVVHTVVGTEGMMGLLLSISVNQIIFFMMFSAFLVLSNSNALFMDLAKALAGGYTGGPAKVAVVSSGFMGMVSGSASGNVATTGAVTIPLMISMGFKRYVAGAVEAVSSTAGQFMPPVMGASAFLIAEYLGISYWAVCIAAAFPACCYFIGMYVVVDIQSRLDGLRGLPKSELPPLWGAFRKTIPLLIPIIVLVVLLSELYSPQWAIVNSIIVLFLVTLFIKGQRMGPIKIIKALSLTGKILIPIATSCATAGIIVGVMSLTGFGNQLSYWITAVAHGHLFYGLLFTACVSLILGMGIPTLGAYVILATIGAPALNQLGASLLGAHLFIFYFACLSAITPPVALAAYVGAGIAAADPWKVGWTAVRLGIIKFIIPFIFVYRPGMLIEGSFFTIIYHMAEMLLLLIPVSVLTQGGYWYEKLNLLEKILFFASILAVCSFSFNPLSFPMGIVLEALAVVLHIMRHKRNIKLQSIAA